MTAPLRLVPPSPTTCCMPWHARGFEAVPVVGGRCCFCDREIAVPALNAPTTAACIYCGFDRGLIPLAEVEPCGRTPDVCA